MALVTSRKSVPFYVILMGIGASSMLVPAIHAGVLGDYETSRPFLYGAVLFLFLALVMALATSRVRRLADERAYLLSLFGAFTILPLMLAVPFAEAVPDTRFLNAYVEMVSAMTTTGATLFDPDRLPMSVHLWRGLVAWLGGALVWVTAFAIMAPLTLGGFEVTSELEAGRGRKTRGTYEDVDPGVRIWSFTKLFLPIYSALTLVLWVILILCGDISSVALIHAMSTLSTSGISPLDSVHSGGAGFASEVAIFLFLIFAVSRRTFSKAFSPGGWKSLRKDRELRVAALFVGGVPLILMIRHWLGAIEMQNADPFLLLKALWGALFTTASFLTTTGFISASWAEAQNWSGLAAPGLVLAGLAIMGGGVATTAGGVKLLRVYALYKHGLREMEKLVHPHSVGGAGLMARRLRREGAAIAWVFFMLFALSIALVMAALSLTGLNFEETIILSVATLSTTGPLAEVAGELPISYANLSDATKLILCAAMVLGRLETLAIIALLNPEFWRS